MSPPPDKQKPKTWGDIYQPLQLPQFLRYAPGEEERLERERLAMHDKPLPDEADDDYPCGINTPDWEGKWLSPCSVEVKRVTAFMAEHGATCSKGLDRIEQASRPAWCEVTVYCRCGASADVTHWGHA
jgi:hypothetical protein